MDDESTLSSRFFEENAAEIVRMLQPFAEPEARALLARARTLVTVFSMWMHLRPSSEERVGRIAELFDVQRSAMEYCAARGRKMSPQ